MATGAEAYSNRLPGIGSTWSSPIADTAGHLFFASGGKSFVIRAGADFAILSTNDLSDPNHASPAAANGKLYILGRKQLYCVGSK